MDVKTSWLNLEINCEIFLPPRSALLYIAFESKKGINMLVKESQRLAKRALGLPRKERARIAMTLLNSLDEPEESCEPDALEKLWIAEIEARIDACERGLVKTVPLDEVKRRFAMRNRR
jgi:putative addiction module component (TIGR02574 family)